MNSRSEPPQKRLKKSPSNFSFTRREGVGKARRSTKERSNRPRQFLLVLEDAELIPTASGSRTRLAGAVVPPPWADESGTGRTEAANRPRPEVVHQVLLAVQDSLVGATDRCAVRVLIVPKQETGPASPPLLLTVEPATRIPRTFSRFAGLFASLLAQHRPYHKGKGSGRSGPAPPCVDEADHGDGEVPCLIRPMRTSLAAVASILAARGVPVFSIASYEDDATLLPREDMAQLLTGRASVRSSSDGSSRKRNERTASEHLLPWEDSVPENLVGCATVSLSLQSNSVRAAPATPGVSAVGNGRRGWTSAAAAALAAADPLWPWHEVTVHRASLSAYSLAPWVLVSRLCNLLERAL